MTVSKIAQDLADNHPQLMKKDIDHTCAIIVKAMKESLRNGNRIEIRGFGTFETKQQKSRMARNPKTGEDVYVFAHRKVHFKPSKQVLHKLNAEQPAEQTTQKHL